MVFLTHFSEMASLTDWNRTCVSSSQSISTHHSCQSLLCDFCNWNKIRGLKTMYFIFNFTPLYGTKAGGI